MKTIVLLSLCALIFSCKNKTSTTNSAYTVDSTDTAAQVQADHRAEPVTFSPPGGCYEMVLNKDSVSLNMEFQDSVVNGNLNYMFYEKDANMGTINGTWKDSIIHTYYTFRSEGVISVREMAWKINGDELWPAIGEIAQRNDTFYYLKPDRLQFDSVNPFLKITCKL